MSKKIVSFCLLLVILVTLAVPVFAAEGELENWYNSQQPFGESVYFYDQVDDSPVAIYLNTGLSYSNPASDMTGTMSFGFSSESGVDGWEISMLNAYDYYCNLVVYAEVEDESEFTFFPTRFTIEYNDHEGNNVNATLDNLNISHFDTSHYLGFTCTGRIPDNDYFGCPIRMFKAHGATGSYPANLRVYMLIYQVPKASDGGSVDVSAIVDAINNQTLTLTSLIQGNGGNPAADETNSSLNDAIDNVDEVEEGIYDLASQAFEMNLDNIEGVAHVSEFYGLEANFYSSISTALLDSLGYLFFFIAIPLFLLIVGVFTGKSR